MLESPLGTRSGRVQSEEDLPYRLAARLVGAHDVGAALDEHADAGSIVLGHAGMQRALGDLGDEVGEGARGNPRPQWSRPIQYPMRAGLARGCDSLGRLRT
jgi:hypothetical protein